MLFIKINNKLFFVKKNSSVIDACNFVGIAVPRFCYHESLSIAGNCRMCLIEILPNLNLKPVSACTLIVSEDANIVTNSPFVLKARENIIETLLLNHPLDCPICDQGGECDLQDQTIKFGIKTSRFFFNKRAVEDKRLNFFIKTIMTRCIHCTRCIRFSNEFIGISLLGTLNRGKFTEIGSYIKSIYTSNVSGNVIDLCPVGALTSNLYSFKGRPWELKTTASIDLTDSTGSNIFISVKDSNIIRILPKKINILNSAFISDKARFSFDAIKNLRILQLYWNKKLDLKISWSTINTQLLFCEINFYLLNRVNLFLISENLNYQQLYFLKLIKNSSGNLFKLAYIPFSWQTPIENYYINSLHSNILKFEQSINVCMLVATNIKLENILLNIKIRSKHLKKKINIFSAGFCYSSNFPNLLITLNVSSLLKCYQAKFFLAYRLINDGRPWFVFGANLITRLDIKKLVFYIKRILPISNILYLNSSSNSESIKYYNIKKINNSLLEKTESLFAYNIFDNLFFHKIIFFLKKVHFFLICSHSSIIAKKANFIIPTLTFFEETGIFINFEGTSQIARRSLFNVNKNIVKLDFLIKFFNTVYLNSINILNKSFFYFFIESALLNTSNYTFAFNVFNKYKIFLVSFILKYPFKPMFEDYYQTDYFSKNSVYLLQRSKEIRNITNNFYKQF